MKYYALLLLVLLTLTNFKSDKHRYAKNYQERTAPAGTIKIADNFFADEIEVTNQYWLDYLHYLSVHYGKNSDEYLSALPDTTVWSKHVKCLDVFTQIYLRHPGHREHPLVGITQEQARKYCQWRSDRAFEYLLVRAGIIADNLKDLFTIEKYFKGEIKTISYKKLDYYPVYELPTVEQWQKITAYISIYRPRLNRNRMENIISCADSISIVFPYPPNGYYSYYRKAKKGYIYDLEGNVREWLEEEGQTAGSSWLHKSGLNSTLPEKADAATGFRCVAKWKKWGE